MKRFPSLLGALLTLAATTGACGAPACLTPPSGLAGWWPGDGTGDDIAGTNNGVMQGGATATTLGAVGPCFAFNGTNSYVRIPDSVVLRPTNFTLETWVRFSSLDSAGSGGSAAGDQYIVFKQNTRSANFEGLDLSKTRVAGGDVFRFLVTSATAQQARIRSATFLATNVWYHVAAVRGSNFTQIYVNGQLERQTNVAFAQDYGSLPLYFGTSGQAYWDHKFKGTLDEVSLYNRALSPSEVAAVYAAGAAGKCKTINGLTITTQPQSQDVAVGSNAVFTVAAAGAPPVSYQWQFGGAAIPGATNTNLTLTNVQTTDSGSYAVVVTNSAASVTSAVAVLTVLTPPAITAQPQSRTNVAGTTAIFSATATGSVPRSYQWRLNGVVLANGGRISGATASTLTISNVQSADAGNYTLTVSNAAGVVTSTVAALTVTGPPVIVTQPAAQSVVAGVNVLFSVTAAGTPPLSFQWLFNGANLADAGQFSGATSAALSVANAQLTNAGDYTVVVTNVAGSVTSTVAALAVTMPGGCLPPPANLVGWWPGDGNANDIAGANNGAFRGGAVANVAGEVGPAFSFDGTNNYVELPNSAVLQPTNFTLETWVRFSSLDSAGSGGSAAGDQYIVFKQNTRSANFEGLDVSKTRVAGGDVFRFLVTSATAQQARIRSATFLATNVWYHVAAVRGSNFTQLYVNGQLEGQTSVAFGQDYGSLPLYFGTSGQAYWDHKFKGTLDEVSLYSRALSADEIAAIYGAGAAGKCKTVLVPPALTTQPQSLTNAAGTAANFSATATGSVPLRYQWRQNGTSLVDGGRIAGATTNALTISDLQPADAGDYALVVSNGAGSVTSAIAVLTLTGPPTILTQPLTQSVVAGVNVGFSVTASGTAPLRYQWQANGANLSNGGNVSGATGTALTLAAVRTNDTGDYRVVVTNTAGAATSTAVRLTVTVPAPGDSVRADAVVLVNSGSAKYLDFKQFIQPYLDNFGVPYTVQDIATNAPGQSVSNYAVIIIGHSQLDISRTYLNPTVQANISMAVSNGTGLVNFDSDLYTGGTPRYQFVQDIFGFSYGSGAAGSSVSLPATEPYAQMHYLTARHPANDSVWLRGSLSVAGITVPAGATALATTGGRPLVAVKRCGLGRAVQWGGYGWMVSTVLGPVDGLDDLVWRGVVWAARKPFVMRGLPNFVTLRVDDVSGGFGWVHAANAVGFKPFLALFYRNVSEAAALDLRALITSGNATASIHSFDSSTAFFYFNHATEKPWSDSIQAANFALGTQWHTSHGIPISRICATHYSEIGLNAFAGLKAWGMEYVPIEVVPQTIEYYQTPPTPWLIGGPYRLYETPKAGELNWPTYYADWLTVPGHPEFNGQFFNLYSEVRDVSGCGEWCPDNDVTGSISRATQMAKRTLDSMALTTVFTHEWYIGQVSTANWQAILRGVTNNLAPYNPSYVTLDYGCQYVRATRTSRLVSSAYDPASGRVTAAFTGKTDMETGVYVFVGADASITSSFRAVPVFSEACTNDVGGVAVAPLASKVQSPAPSPYFLTPFDQNGNISLTLVGDSGHVCRIESSSDLENWSEVRIVTILDGMAVISEAITADHRFYRATPLP